MNEKRALPLLATRGKARLRALLIAGAVGALIVALAACAPRGEVGPGTDADTSSKPPVAAVPTTEKNAAGVWTAEAWKEIYPHEYETYMQNAMNDTDGNAGDPFFEPRGDMVELYPMLPVIWAGTGFNKF
jgi:nitrite reductase (cytochrome c-552)